MTDQPWVAGRFKIATPGGPVDRSGYIWRGLGLFMVLAASHKRERPPKWSLTHLGTGHAIGFITGEVRTAFPIATEIAEAGDWTFDGLSGWRNQFPDARARVSEIAARHACFTMGGGVAANNEAIAQAIALARA